MTLEGSVSQWIDGLREADERSAQELWQRYFQRLVRLAGGRLPAHARRGFDEEDVALSAFTSLCRGVQRGQFPDVLDRDNLWSLLVVITARKVGHRIRRELAQKRGGGRVLGESMLGRGQSGPMPGIDAVIGDAPTPGFAAEVAEEADLLLDLLEDESLRALALAKMEGMSNEQAAQRFGCSLRTVERRLQLIRRLWSVTAEEG